MTAIYFLAPNGRWSARNLVGDAAVDGTLETFAAGTLDPKVTYADPDGNVPNSVVVDLDAAGEANVYWAYDPEDPELYYIRVYDKDGNLVYDQDDYPTVSTTNGAPPVPEQIENIVRNPQFSFWTNTNNFSGILQSINNVDFFADEWLFERSNTTAVVNISQQFFALGQTLVPANPISYLHYECGDARSASETYKNIFEVYDNVQTYSGQTVSFAFWAKSAISNTISFNWVQNYGTGGSPTAPVTTLLITANLTTAWRKYIATVTLPIISGTLGSDNNNFCALKLALPLNTLASSIDITNVQLQPTDAITDFVNQGFQQQSVHLADTINLAQATTGDIKFSLQNSINGWLLCADATTIGNGASGATYAGLACKALFNVIWNNVSNTFAIIYNSDGTVGTRGASGDADYAANKRLQITTSQGRVIANAAGITPLGTTAGASTATFSGICSGTTSTLVTFSITLATINLPAHSHTITDPMHRHPLLGTFQNNVADGAAHSSYTDSAGNTELASTGITGTNNTGSGTPYSLSNTFAGTFSGTCSGSGVSTIQPTIYYNMFMKL